MLRFASICLLLSYVFFLDLESFQMDAKTACLNGNLKEQIYIDQSIGFVSKGQEGKSVSS